VGRIQQKGRRENEEAAWWKSDVLPVDDCNPGTVVGRKHQVATRGPITKGQMGGNEMKWGGYNRKGEERMKKLFSGKAMYYLLTIATLGLLLAESIKWRPEGR
jgi:hypothetical protein